MKKVFAINFRQDYLVLITNAFMVAKLGSTAPQQLSRFYGYFRLLKDDTQANTDLATTDRGVYVFYRGPLLEESRAQLPPPPPRTFHFGNPNLFKSIRVFAGGC